VVFDKLKQMFGGGGSGTPRVDVKKRFHILGKSGMGSMSQVYRAKDLELGRVVCLKILDKEKTAKFEARFAGLQRPSEGAICIDFHHPNVVQTMAHGLTTNDEQFLVMEWIDGAGLHSLVESSHAQLNGNRIKYLAGIAEAVHYLHQQKCLHRDICPRNVIIDEKGVAKLIDFGLTLPYRPEFCKPGNRTGTAQYLAPEIIKRTTTDLRVDLFALGVTAYEVFTGELPWGKVESMQTLLSHMNSPGQDPRDFRPDLDEATAQFLNKSIEREPIKRFQSATAFRDALKMLPKKH
jgi:eukaryotic-like serine/threonine-protein kinase